MTGNEVRTSPLAGMDTSFAGYVRRRMAKDGLHMDNGVPDYAFALDYELRRKLAKIPFFDNICQKVMETYVAQEIQTINQQGLAVGPNQYPEIYEMGKDCAHKLGIAIPNIFVVYSASMNAYTVAADDVSPIVVLYSALLERMTPGEIKCVIAHECGHIHNRHSVYQSVIRILLGTVNMERPETITPVSIANTLLMQMWTRAGEVTADRAAMICADNIEDAISVNKKFLYGAVMNAHVDVNIDELRRQFEETVNNPMKIMELMTDHPSSIRRILADKEFEECDVLYSWRPDFKKPDTVMRSKAETDERCKKLVNIIRNK